MTKICNAFLMLALSLVFISTGNASELEIAMNKMAKELTGTLPSNLQRPLVLAVINIEGDTGRDRADKLAGALAGLGSDFEVVERNFTRMKDALRELNFSQSDMVDESKALKIGQALGAKGLVYGKSQLFDKEERLTAWIMLPEEMKRLATKYVTIRRTLPASDGALRSALIPGWGQWHLGRQGVGAAFLISTVGLGVGALYASGQASSAYDDSFLAGSVADRDRLLKKQDDWKSRRNILIAGVGVMWLSNILHAAWVSSHTPIYAQVEMGEQSRVALAIRF